jgi:hypothetical protein
MGQQNAAGKRAKNAVQWQRLLGIDIEASS